MPEFDLKAFRPTTYDLVAAIMGTAFAILVFLAATSWMDTVTMFLNPWWIVSAIASNVFVARAFFWKMVEARSSRYEPGLPFLIGVINVMLFGFLAIPLAGSAWALLYLFQGFAMLVFLPLCVVAYEVMRTLAIREAKRQGRYA
ncbi:MAG TPA: hypothetical protein VGE01_10490 [Fimbriimonas sp.]